MREALPKDFLWGFATASYQIEGATTADGRGPSIWDTFCAKPGKIADGSSGETACDSYNRTKDDIDLLKQISAKVYRFSISWTRVIPLGGRNDPVNQKGIDHYVKFVDDLLAAGIVPFVTLSHWDIPEELDKRYGGFLNKDEFVADFVHFARIMFEAMGDRVKHWITFNESYCSAILGYSLGIFAPGRTSDRSKNDVGDGSTEPWIVGHNILMAHAHTVKLFRDEFKPVSGGEIGITLNGDWTLPWDSQSQVDIDAAQRKQEFTIAWFADPIYYGRYPASMVEQLGPRLPTFSEEEASLIKGSNDFYGMNTYCTHFIKGRTDPPTDDDIHGNLETLFENKEGVSVGALTQSAWMRANPAGFREMICWISNRYARPRIYVTENGTSIKGENDLEPEAILSDDFRCWFFEEYIKAMAQAVAEDGCDVRGYMAWSLLDNFEWADGYETRFGVTYVDYENGQKRIPKKSAMQMKGVFEKYMGNL